MKTYDDAYFKRLCQDLGFEMLAADRDLRIRFCNDCAARQFGSDAQALIGTPLLDLLREPEREKVRDLLDRTLGSGDSGEIEVKYVDPEGTRRTFVLISSPIRNPEGSCIGVSVCMRDISHRKQLSQELAESRRMAALGNMAGGVAHHFNNILGGMLTSIDYVLPSDSPRDLRRTLRLLAQAIGRATRITKQLAAFAEAENEQGEWVELNPLMDTFKEWLREQAEQRDVELVTRIEAIPSRPFETQRLMPVLESLAQNAFDSMRAGGTLTVEMRGENDKAVITIADTGCGMAESVLDRVFEPFFTTKGELGGGETDNIGLGLAAVHGLVAEMGGSIELSSKVGVGTQVRLQLPIGEDAPSRSGTRDGVP